MNSMGVIFRPGRVDYPVAWAWQKRLVEQRLRGQIPDSLLLLEHPPVFTLGRSASPEHLLADEATLARLGISVFHIERGGDITYHGPGQIVGYPILDLSGHRKDVRWYVRQLEEVLIRALSDFGVHGERQDGRTGVWVGDEKVAAIGVRISRWVTMHGFALNVNTDLSYFRYIVPCGIRDRGVTSLQRCLGSDLALEKVGDAIVDHFEGLFHLKFECSESYEPASAQAS
ncbi:MAG: lipoyl(octanoyl) transferase LipB [Acidobacteria bacterium]|nr:lipoyl(octanoyl) transferase LipB [Acidobacteriota bacterium]